MDGYENKKKETKKSTDIQTFPIPFSLKEIKQNITITPSNPIKYTKEQIINRAFNFHSQGNILEAEKYYKEFTNQEFKDYRVFSNYGNILQTLGKFKKAELYQRKAIENKPDFAIGHYNLGNTLRTLGKLKEAEVSYRKAIEFNPNLAEAYANLGNILKDLGKSEDAELATRKAIELNPNLANAHFNLGTILNDFDKLQDAELAYRKAIELKPKFADAYFNLGNILREIGQLKQAEILTRKAIELKPNFAEGYFNLGNILKDMEKLEEAKLFTVKAIELKPKFAEGYFNLGNIYMNLGNAKKALYSYLKAIDIDPRLDIIYHSVTLLLKDSDPTKFKKSELNNIVSLLLERNDINHQDLFKTINFCCRTIILTNLEKVESKSSNFELFNNHKLIIIAFEKIIFKDAEIEKKLTNARRNMCDQIANSRKILNYYELQFLIALGKQCYLNEYVYSLNEKENKSVSSIIKKYKNTEINETVIAILSCYFPLYKLLDTIPSLKSFNSSNQSVKELIKLQIIEPLKEIEISKKIKSLGSINDKISLAVKSQYEENPYPRWLYGNSFEKQKFTIPRAINSEINPNSINLYDEYYQLKVLIAGCGTGNQILQAQRYKNAHITAVDLSLSSLAYAQRKINQLEINNVDLIQMDILEINLLKKQFDIIECGGVLHHMDNPSRGLKELLGVLKDNGFLKLGLYSELARKDIEKARNYISNKNLQPTNENIRNFRQKVLSDELCDLNSLKKAQDFYSLSQCRDLCFHTKEHRFTIEKLIESLKYNELIFLGFSLPKSIKSTYKKNFPEDTNQTNLYNWATFEERYPDTFLGMYQFWVCKENKNKCRILNPQDSS